MKGGRFGLAVIFRDCGPTHAMPVRSLTERAPPLRCRRRRRLRQALAEVEDIFLLCHSIRQPKRKSPSTDRRIHWPINPQSIRSHKRTYLAVAPGIGALLPLDRRQHQRSLRHCLGHSRARSINQITGDAIAGPASISNVAAGSSGPAVGTSLVPWLLGWSVSDRPCA